MASASAQSLLGLMTQLQSLESSFISVLMEAALKLSSITDTSVFLMVETQEGRRFSGKRHLCDAYLRGALTPTGRDVEYDVDPSVVALQQRSTIMQQQQLLQQQQQQQQQQQPHQSYPSPSCLLNSDFVGGGNSRKRSNTLPIPAVSLPFKQTRKNHIGNSSQQPQQQQHSSPTAVEDVKIENGDAFKVETFPVSSSSNSSDVPPLLSLASSFDLSSSYPSVSVDGDVVLVDSEEADGDAAEIIDDDDDDNDGDSTMTTTMTTTTRLPMTTGATAPWNDSFSSLELCETTTTSTTSASAAAAAVEAYRDSVPFSIPASFGKKMEALRSLTSPAVFEKLSIEHRLFTSCVYQLGSVLAKHVVANAVDFQSTTTLEDFFNHHVTLWLQNFPYLAESDAGGVRVDAGKGGMAINAFVRHRARNSFRKGCLIHANKTNLVMAE